MWRLRILQQKTKHYTKNSAKRYVMSYIRFGFERNGTERGGDLHHHKTPQYPLPNIMSHTIAYLLQKKQQYTYRLIYLYLVLQTLPSHLSNKKTAFIAQKYAIFSMNSNYTWYCVQQKNNALNKKMLYSIGCLYKKHPVTLFYLYPIIV